MTPSEKITKARAGIILDLPFFGSLALRLRVIEDPTCPTAWTDGDRMGYNPGFINNLPLNHVKGLICHEVMHCACAHMARRGARDHKKWNIAGDYAINQIIEDCKISLPDGRLLDPAYKGMSADEIYNRLPTPPPDKGGNGDGSGSPSSPSPLRGEGKGEGESSDPGGCGEVRDAVSSSPSPLRGEGKGEGVPSPADIAQAEQNWKIAVGQAAQAAKMMGKLPAGLKRLVEEILEPKVDWKEVLRRFIDQSARNDYRWFPANRRYISQGLYLPSLKSEELPPVVIAVDTSGSIGGEEINQFAAEMTAILREHQTSCTVIYCDAEVANVEEFTSEDLPLVLNPKGGGGTDFKPPFAWVEEKGLQPSCLIYLTDMECNSFPKPPGYPVLWAKIGKGGSVPPFGEEVKV